MLVVTVLIYCNNSKYYNDYANYYAHYTGAVS